MIETPASLMLHDQPLSSTQDDQAIEVEQQKISADMQIYINLLVKQPFVKEGVMDSRHIVRRMPGFWPRLPGFEKQETALWREIEDILRAVPIVRINHKILLHVAVSSSHLLPGPLPQTNESGVVMAFDSIEGVRRRYIVPMSDQAQVLDTMGISSGLMITCQWLLPLINPTEDNRKHGLGAGNIYAEREHDKIKSADEVAAEEQEMKSIVPGAFVPEETNHRHEAESDAERIAQTADVAADAESFENIEAGHREGPQKEAAKQKLEGEKKQEEAGADIKKESRDEALSEMGKSKDEVAKTEPEPELEVEVGAGPEPAAEGEAEKSEKTKKTKKTGEIADDIAIAESEVTGMESETEDKSEDKINALEEDEGTFPDAAQDMPERPAGAETAEIRSASQSAATEKQGRPESADALEASEKPKLSAAETAENAKSEGKADLASVAPKSVAEEAAQTEPDQTESDQTELGQESSQETKTAEKAAEDPALAASQEEQISEKPPESEGEDVSEPEADSSTDSEPALSVVDQNYKGQQQIREAEKEAGDHEDRSDSGEQQEEGPSAQEIKDKADQIKEMFGEEDSAEKRMEPAHQISEHSSASPTLHKMAEPDHGRASLLEHPSAIETESPIQRIIAPHAPHEAAALTRKRSAAADFTTKATEPEKGAPRSSKRKKVKNSPKITSVRQQGKLIKNKQAQSEASATNKPAAEHLEKLTPG